MADAGFAPDHLIFLSRRVAVENGQPTTVAQACQIFGLIIRVRGVKPAVVMKTLSGRFRFIVFGVIVIAAVVSCCNYDFVVPGTIVPGTRSFAFVDIGTDQRAPGYVEWKDEDQFKKALKQVRGHNGEYCLCVMMNPNDTPHPYDSYNKCPSGYKCPPANIRTVKVTKSKAAHNIAAGESAVNDPNITYRVQSPYPGDISNVLNALR